MKLEPHSVSCCLCSTGWMGVMPRLSSEALNPSLLQTSYWIENTWPQEAQIQSLYILV